MPWLFLALALVGSHSYMFYKGSHYANQDNIIRQQTAKLRHIEISRRYYKDSDQLSKAAASEANERLEATAAQLRKIEDDIKAGRLGKACSDKLFEELRKVR